MLAYALALSLHVLGATLWVGGHLALVVAVLPRALRERDPQRLLDFERGYEPWGMGALGVQVLTGLWLAYHYLGAPGQWFAANPLARVVQLKLALLLATLGIAFHARFRVLPRLRAETLPLMAWHVRAVSLVAVLLALAGASIRYGGWFR